MSKTNAGFLNQFFRDVVEKHRCKSKKVGRVIVAACLAAVKIFDSPVYHGYYGSNIEVIMWGKFIPLRLIKEEIGAKTLKEMVEKFDFPEDTRFFQMFFVSFGHLKTIILQLDGRLEKGRLKWEIKSVYSHGYPELLTEEELKGLS